LTDKGFEKNDAFRRMIQIGSLCSTASIENISIVDKIEVPLEGSTVSVNCDWFTYKSVKTTGSATEAGIIKYC